MATAAKKVEAKVEVSPEGVEIVSKPKEPGWLDLKAIAIGPFWKAVVKLAPPKDKQDTRPVIQYECSVVKKGFSYTSRFMETVYEMEAEYRAAHEVCLKIEAAARGWLTHSVNGDFLRHGLWIVNHTERKAAGSLSNEEFKLKATGAQLCELLAEGVEITYFHPKLKKWLAPPAMVGVDEAVVTLEEEEPEAPPVEEEPEA